MGRLLALCRGAYCFRQRHRHPRLLSLQSTVPSPRKILRDRDLFGECVAAAKKRGMRVVARMSPDLNWGDALEAHPEWAMRHADGSVQYSGEEPRLFKTCMPLPTWTTTFPAIMREINALTKWTVSTPTVGLRWGTCPTATVRTATTPPSSSGRAHQRVRR